jgi:hypothetical protein
MDWIGLDNVPTAIKHRRDFNAGNVRGRRVTPDYALYTGRLDSTWTARLREDYNNHLVTYVVTSHDTPIAWELGIGSVFIPRVRYSVSTSRHQNIAAKAFAGLKIETSPHS